MPQEIKQVRVFVASPSGLDEERQAIRGAAEEVNEMLANEIGYRIEIFGWEDTISGAGRPQSIINDEMDLCELFIGILWRNWGSKPDVAGRFSSGFEEEFTLSFEKQQKIGEPHIHLFFKTVDQLSQRDAGPDLKKVLEFRRKIEEEKLCLYQTFESADILKNIVRRILSRYIIKNYKADGLVDHDSGEDGAAQKKEVPAVGHEVGRLGELEFVQEAIEAIGEGNEPHIGSTEVARLRLMACTANSDANDNERLGPHDYNLLYANRKGMQISDLEKRILVRSSLSAFDEENRPLWTWLKELSSSDPNALWRFTATGEVEERVEGFRLCALLWPVLPLSPETLDELARNFWFRLENPAPIKEAALTFLAVVGTDAELPLLEWVEKEAADTDLSLMASKAILQILLRTSRESAVKKLLSTAIDRLGPFALKDVLDSLESVKSSDLIKALDYRLPEVRGRALEILYSRGEADNPMLERALADPDHSVRLKSLLLLEKKGEGVPRKRASEILSDRTTALGSGLLFRRNWSPQYTEFLQQRLKYASTNTLRELATGKGSVAGQAWIELAFRKFSEFGQELRDHLDDEFRRFAEIYASDEASTYSALNALFIGDPADAQRRRYLGLAIDVLARHGTEDDYPRILRASKGRGGRVSEVVAGYLVKHATEEDVVVLARLYKGGFRQFSDEQAESVPLTKLIVEVCSSLDEILADDGIHHDLKHDLLYLATEREVRKLERSTKMYLLQHGHSLVRKAAALRVVQACSKREIEQLTSALLDSVTYFYSAIFWLDVGRAFARSQAKIIAKREVDRLRRPVDLSFSRY